MPDLIGKTIGSYRIVSQIGLGGMATVFKAYQPSMDRYVALKVLSTHLAQDTNFIKRFQQEAKIIAKLEHLHILPVYDHGEQDGYLYLVMRFIEAGTLKDRLQQGPLSLGGARRVVQQVGSALEYAHQLGVIHRDMKPSNILVDPQGDCYLTDFGIAKIVEGTLGLTGSGIVGTPHYMAPEQSRSHTVDHRADIYAMGVVIYEMVTGQLPYDAETPFAVVMKHISEPLPLPRAIRPDLPEAVERVILRALAKDPADRYQSMRDLVTAFDQAVQTAPDKALAPHVSPAREPAAAPALTPTVLISRRASLQRWLAAQPAWLLPAAGLALVVMVLAGVILSRIPGRVEIAGGQLQLVTPTAAVASQAATPASAAELVATPMPTPQPRVTPIQAAIPTGPCRIANVQDDGDIYVRNCDGSGVRQVTFLKSIFGLGQGPLSWSPDGQYIVFQSTHERQPGADPSLYLIKSDGSNLTRLTFGDRHDKFPAWSPDGRRIAMDRNGSLVTIAPDGSDEQVIVRETDEINVNTIAWSPDGQQLAFASWHGPFPDSLNFVVYVVNSNGSNLRKLGKFKGGITPTWSPASKQIGVEVGLGQAEEAYLLNADGSGEPVKVPSIPTSWHHWYWPQWDGKAQVATSPASPMAGQARALAEPILKAIADRPLDFQDDFSTAGKGWGIGGEPKEGSAIQDGVARLRVNDGSASLGNEVLNRKDFPAGGCARCRRGQGNSVECELSQPVERILVLCSGQQHKQHLAR